ncbi:MAG TPA: hypothetical protein VN033_05915 [Vulgatibacter sp.]|nr:hypothetical protein [Vulgatibacter sp.]
MKRSKTIPLTTAALCALLASCGAEPVYYDGPLDPVTIHVFSSSPKKIAAGESAILSWSTSDAVFVEVRDDTHALVGGDDLGVNEGTLEVSPRRTTRYTLAAFGASGTQRLDHVKVEVEPGTKAPTLQAGSKKISLGSSTSLKWEAPGASSTRLLAGEDELLADAGPEGSLEVSPEHTTRYELEATFADGSTSSAKATIEVAPVIESFWASPSGPQLEGTKVYLLWETTGADGVYLRGKGVEYDAPAERIESGAWLVDAGEGQVDLVATRDGAEATASVHVDLLVAPTIERFEVSPGEVTAGPDLPAKVTVSWEVEGAEEVLLLQGDEEPVHLEAKGAREVLVRTTTTFALKANNPAGEVADEITVTAIPPATIESFLPSAKQVQAGEPFTISWTTRDAISVRLLEGDRPMADTDLALSGEIETQIEKTTRFRLVAYNEAGVPTSKELEVEVVPEGN